MRDDVCQLNTPENSCRPDGTDLIKQRRPDLYKKLTQSMEELPFNTTDDNVPVTANTAIFATYKSNEYAIDDVCHYIENNLSDIIQLPELFFIKDLQEAYDIQQLAEITRLSNQLIKQVSEVLRPFQYVCTSLVIDGMHQAVIIGENGLVASQKQLHFCNRVQWTALGDEINIIALPLEQGIINIAMLTADDANIPEVVKIVAARGIHLLLVPFDIQQPSEVEYSLIARATENRICILAASREKSFPACSSSDNSSNNNTNTNVSNPSKNKNKIKHRKSTGLIINLATTSPSSAQWRKQKFDDNSNKPIVTHQHGKITKAVVHPIAACIKVL